MKCATTAPTKPVASAPNRMLKRCSIPAKRPFISTSEVVDVALQLGPNLADLGVNLPEALFGSPGEFIHRLVVPGALRGLHATTVGEDRHTRGTRDCANSVTSGSVVRKITCAADA
jgi:hypothetical protein